MTVPARTDLHVGDRFTARSDGLDPADARIAVDLLGYTHPLFAGSAPPPMVPGQLVLALAAGALESSDRMGSDVIALVGMDDIRFPSSLEPGQRLDIDVEVAHRRPTTRGDRTILVLDLRGRVGDRLVMTATTSFLLKTRTD